MKKIKILPSVLMLIACIAVLGVGVFAVAPTKNTISGSITINSANPEVLISAYKYDENGDVEANPFFPETPARSGINIDIGNTLSFDTSTVNTTEQLSELDINILIKIKNPSTTKLGAYFSIKEATTSTVEDNTLIASEKQLTTQGENDELVKATFSDYAILSANNGECELVLTFKLLDFITGANDTVNLATPGNEIYLNIEDVNPAYEPVVIGEGQTTVTSAMVGGYSNLVNVKIAEGVKVIDRGAFENCSTIEKIILPSTLTEINYYSFKNCSALKELVFTNTFDITKIKEGAFENCPQLGVVEDGARYLKVNNNPYAILLEIINATPEYHVKQGVEMLIGSLYNGGVNELYIPNSVKVINNLGDHGPDGGVTWVNLSSLLKKIHIASGTTCSISQIAYNSNYDENLRNEIYSCYSFEEITQTEIYSFASSYDKYPFEDLDYQYIEFSNLSTKTYNTDTTIWVFWFGDDI